MKKYFVWAVALMLVLSTLALCMTACDPDECADARAETEKTGSGSRAHKRAACNGFTEPGTLLLCKSPSPPPAKNSSPKPKNFCSAFAKGGTYPQANSRRTLIKAMRA